MRKRQERESSAVVFVAGRQYVMLEPEMEKDWNFKKYIDKEGHCIFPDGLPEIFENAFKDYSFMTSIEIPDSVETIKESAFECCTNLTSITIPDSVTKIGNRAFAGCTNLTSLIIPDSVEGIDSSAFENCPKLTVTCSPDSEAWKYCKKHRIRVSAPKNRNNRFIKLFSSHRK